VAGFFERCAYRNGFLPEKPELWRKVVTEQAGLKKLNEWEAWDVDPHSFHA
jgi:hypothetical protein